MVVGPGTLFRGLHICFPKKRVRFDKLSLLSDASRIEASLRVAVNVTARWVSHPTTHLLSFTPPSSYIYHPKFPFLTFTFFNLSPLELLSVLRSSF